MTQPPFEYESLSTTLHFLTLTSGWPDNGDTRWPTVAATLDQDRQDAADVLLRGIEAVAGDNPDKVLGWCEVPPQDAAEALAIRDLPNLGEIIIPTYTFANHPMVYLGPIPPGRDRQIDWFSAPVLPAAGKVPGQQLDIDRLIVLRAHTAPANPDSLCHDPSCEQDYHPLTGYAQLLYHTDGERSPIEYLGVFMLTPGRLSDTPHLLLPEASSPMVTLLTQATAVIAQIISFHFRPKGPPPVDSDEGGLSLSSRPALPPLPRSASREDRVKWSVDRFLKEILSEPEGISTAYHNINGKQVDYRFYQQTEHQRVREVTADAIGLLFSLDKETGRRVERYEGYMNHPRVCAPPLNLGGKVLVVVTTNQSHTGKIMTFTVAGEQPSEIRDLIVLAYHPTSSATKESDLAKLACKRSWCREQHGMLLCFNVVRRTNDSSSMTHQLTPAIIGLEPGANIHDAVMGWHRHIDAPLEWLFTLVITAYSILAVALHQDTPRPRKPMDLEQVTFRGINIIDVAQNNGDQPAQNKMVGGLMSAWKEAKADLRICDWDTRLLEAINRAAESYSLTEVAFPNLPAPDRLVLFTNMERGYLFHSVDDGMDVESILFGRMHHLDQQGNVTADLWGKTGVPGIGEHMDACINPGCKVPHLILVTVVVQDAYGLHRVAFPTKPFPTVGYAPIAFSTDQPDMGAYLERLRDSSREMLGSVRDAVTWLACAVQFLSGKITRTSRHRATYKRHWRRNLETDPIPPPEEYQVVELRPVEYVNKPSRDGEEPVTVDWQVQWIVRGHTRKQWYPSERLHRNIFIQPYRKGPEDKPLVHVNKYFLVDR